MLDKLKEIKNRYEFVAQQVVLPEVISDNEQYRKLMKEHKNLTPLMEKYDEYLAAETEMDEAKGMLDEGGLEPDFKEMVQAEYLDAKQRCEELEEEIKILLIPKDENDDNNTIVEIRGGAGGDEAALFAGSLFRMYSMYAERTRLKVEILNANETDLQGYKEISFLISGEGAYGRLKFESGVHRVQRVPETETQGRIHTSTVTVAVLPEVEEIDFEINTSDVQVDTFRASGAGGQHVNKTESAIRLTYLPTGLVVECQDERSQHKNRDRAFKILRSKLYEEKQREQADAIAKERKSQVGTGDRSERIRTYNYPQGRLTDHRIGLTLYRLEAIMNGDLDEVIDSLITADRAEKLKASESDDN